MCTVGVFLANDFVRTAQVQTKEKLQQLKNIQTAKFCRWLVHDSSGSIHVCPTAI